MIALVPLIMAGYPMINIDLDQGAEYENGIERVSCWAVDVCALFMVIFIQAHKGDHAPMMKCLVNGMQKMFRNFST